MRLILIGLLMIAPASAFAFTPPVGYQSDFSSAKQCRDIDGRHVWQGQQGYYIQNWLLNQPGQIDPDTVGVVDLNDNAADVLQPFVDACK